MSYLTYALKALSYIKQQKKNQQKSKSITETSIYSNDHNTK